MTSVELESYFDLLTDKIGSPYFTQSEKTKFLNQAQIQYVNDTLPSNQDGVVNIEVSSPVINNIRTLIYETGNLNPNSSGQILVTAIQSALNTASSSTEPLMYTMAVSYNGYPCRWTRHNDWYEIENNYYKRGSSTSPRYKIFSGNFTVSPATISANVKFTLLKYPKDINLGMSVTSELPSQTHKTLVETAVTIASVAMRDMELKQMNNEK